MERHIVIEDPVEDGIKSDIAIPCDDCPLRPEVDFIKTKVSFSASGIIQYEPYNEDPCGLSYKWAEGPEAEEVRQNIKMCRGPEYDTKRRLGVFGVKKIPVRCPAFPVDPTNSNVVTAFLTRIQERREG